MFWQKKHAFKKKITLPNWRKKIPVPYGQRLSDNYTWKGKAQRSRASSKVPRKLSDLSVNSLIYKSEELDKSKVFENLKKLEKLGNVEAPNKWEKSSQSDIADLEAFCEETKKAVKKRIPAKDKFTVFSQNADLPLQYQKKFFLMLRRKRIGVPGNYKYPTPKKIHVPDIQKLRIIRAGYSLILGAFLSYYGPKIAQLESPERSEFYGSILTVDMFYYFFDKYFEEFFHYSDIIQEFQVAKILDSQIMTYLFDFYNLSSFFLVKALYVILNLEDLKYEHDKYFKDPKQWDKIKQMQLNCLGLDDWFNYTGSFFGSFCVFEVSLEFHESNFSLFSAEFFSRSFYDKKVKILKKFNQQETQIPYVNWYNLVKYNYILPYDSHALPIPALFFFFHTFYMIHYKRMRYNAYIRNHKGLYTYTSLKTWLIHKGNPLGGNRYQQPMWYFYKHIALRYFDKENTHFSKNTLIKGFNLYVGVDKRNSFILEEDDNKNIFNLIVNSRDSLNWSYFTEMQIEDSLNFLRDFALAYFEDFLVSYDTKNGFNLVMKFKSNKKFSIRKYPYLRLDHFLKEVYGLPFSRIYYHLHETKKLLYRVMVDIYKRTFEQHYFFKDLYNATDEEFINNAFNLVPFYNQITNLTNYAIDPEVFKKFYEQAWPKGARYFPQISLYSSNFLIYYGIDAINQTRPLSDIVIKYDLFDFYVKWSLNVNNFECYANPWYAYANNIINKFNKNRVHNIGNRFVFFLEHNKLKTNLLFQNSRYFIAFKAFYFQLLYEDIEYSLLFFLMNPERFWLIWSKFNNYLYNDLTSLMAANFTYRFNSLRFMTTYDYYKDWFYNQSKIDFWLYHDFKKYEGKKFYRKENDIL